MECYWLASRKSPIWEEPIPDPAPRHHEHAVLSTARKERCWYWKAGPGPSLCFGRNKAHAKGLPNRKSIGIQPDQTNCPPSKPLFITRHLCSSLSWSSLFVSGISWTCFFLLFFSYCHVFGKLFELHNPSRYVRSPPP
jgi:hypothetical protein